MPPIYHDIPPRRHRQQVLASESNAREFRANPARQRHIENIQKSLFTCRADDIQKVARRLGFTQHRATSLSLQTLCACVFSELTLRVTRDEGVANDLPCPESPHNRHSRRPWRVDLPDSGIPEAAFDLFG